MNDEHNANVFVKSSARYRNILQQHGLPKGSGGEPRRIAPTKVLPSPFNRRGRPFNFQYIHMELCPNIKKDGFRQDRPSPGIVVRRSGENLVRLHATSRELMVTCGKLLPSMTIDETANRECLGGNHLTMALRMFSASYTSSISGARFEVKGDEELKDVCAEGHHYIELDENVSDDDCKFLSELLNSDQNQNQTNSEDHLRLHIKQMLDGLITPERPMVPTSTIITKVIDTSIVKLRPDHVGDTAQFIVGFHGSPYVDQLSRWYAQNVNPRQLSISARWMADIARTFGKTRPLCKLAATLVHYRGFVVTPGTAPNPDTSRTIDVPLMTNLAQNSAADLDWLEEEMRTYRAKFSGYMTTKLGSDMAADQFLGVEELAMRLLCGKTMVLQGFTHGVSGKFSKEKVEDLYKCWAKNMGTSHDELKTMALDLKMDTKVAEEVRWL